WGDPFVDFGIELYVAWRLTEGEHLYRDIYWLGGPLSQYANALWFRLGGVSYQTLTFVNLACLAGLTALLYRFFAQTVGRLAGLTAGLLLLVVFAFQLYEPNGSWSYIAPYRHEAVHGLGLAVLGLSLFRDYLIKGGTWRACVIGLCFGAVSLTKIEPTLAMAVALASGYVLSLNYAPPGRIKWRQDTVGFVGGALVLPVGFGLYLGSHMPVAVAVTGLLGNWIMVGQTDAAGQAFYQRIMGLGRWQENLVWVASGAGICLGAVAVGLWCEWKLREVVRGRLVWSAAVIGGLWFVSSAYMPWPLFLRPLPVLTGLSVAWLAWVTVQGQDPEVSARRWIPLLTWGVFGLVLLGKIGLAAHAGGYGFTLALPSTLLVAAILIDLLPETLSARGWGRGDLVRAGAAGVGLAFLLAAQEASSAFHTAKTMPLGDGPDRMFAFAPPFSDQAATLGPALEDLAQLLPKDATLFVVPDGAIVNYLLRCRNPTPYVVLDPLMLTAAGGESQVVERLAAQPPDYVLFVARDFQEYGFGRFGQDARCGRLITTWIAEHYEVLRVYGAPPASPDFGCVVLRRRSPSSPPQSTP
ncbi:MAG: hypothetical protein SNJ62_12850, partial [Chloracidobacterium sp.]